MAKQKNIQEQDVIVLEADGVDDIVVTAAQAKRILEHPHNDVAGWRVKTEVDADNSNRASAQAFATE